MRRPSWRRRPADCAKRPATRTCARSSIPVFRQGAADSIHRSSSEDADFLAYCAAAFTLGHLLVFLLLLNNGQHLFTTLTIPAYVAGAFYLHDVHISHHSACFCGPCSCTCILAPATIHDGQPRRHTYPFFFGFVVRVSLVCTLLCAVVPCTCSCTACYRC